MGFILLKFGYLHVVELTIRHPLIWLWLILVECYPILRLIQHHWGV